MILDNLRHDYIALVDAVAAGEPVGRSIMLSYELRDVSLTLLDPTDALPLGVGMKLNLGFAAATTLELLAGSHDDALITRTGGERTYREVSEQLGAIYGELFSAPSTRAAGVVSLDRPPTVWHFLFRNERLELHTHAHASDVVWQLPYELFQCTQLQLTMANLLGVAVGEYHHHVTALYLNAGDVGLRDRLHATTEFRRPPQPRGFGVEARTWAEVATRARFVLDVGSGRAIDGVSAVGFSPSERWYLEALRPYWIPQEES